MLLLTYDPNVKQTPDHKVSLVSPYGSEKSMSMYHRQLCKTAYLMYANTLPMSKEERAKLDKEISDFGIILPPPCWDGVR